MEHKTTKVAGIVIAVLSAQAAASSMTVTGVLETKIPTLTATPQGTLYEGVKNSVVTLTPEESLCKILFSSSASAPAGSLGCYAAISSIPAGMALDASAGTLSGFTTAKGNLTVPYVLTYLSGSAKTPVQVGSGNLTFRVEPVTAPKITSMQSKFDEGWSAGYSADIHKRQTAGALRVIGEARPFTQIVEIENFGTCTIPEGATQCDITTTQMLALEGSAVTGNSTFPVSANSSNSYFANFVTSFLMRWDFRPPVVSNVEEGNSESPLDTIGTKAGAQAIPYGHLAALVTSPHYAITTSNWWKPSKTEMTLKLDPESSRTPDLVYNDVTLLSLRDYTNSKGSISVDPNSAYTQTGADEFLFDFDLSDVQDGDFLATITAVDQYGNSSTTSNRKVTLNRHSPKVGFFSKKLDAVSENSTVFFFKDMVIGAWNGYSNGLGSVTASLNGMDVPLTQTGTAGVYTITAQPDTSALVAGQAYPFVIKATDSLGRTTTKTISITWADADLAMTSSPANPVQFTQQTKVTIKQSGAYRCPLSYSAAEAADRAKLENKIVCHAEWTKLPADMAFSVDLTGNASIIGYINEDIAEFRYTLYAHSPDGDSVKVREGGMDVIPKLAVAPTIKFGGKRMQGDHGLMLDTRGGSAGYATVTSSPGELIVSMVSDGLINKSTTVRQRASSGSDVGRNTTYIKVPAGDIWTVRPITVGAKYARSSKFLTQEIVNVYMVPTKNLRMNMERIGKELADTTTAKVKVTVGVPNSDGNLTYDSAAHGEWMVHLIQEVSTKGEAGKITKSTKRLTQDVKTDSSGTAYLEFDPTVVEGDSVAYQAIASVISPIPDFVLQLKSRQARVVMIKGEAIDGTLSNETVVDRVPLKASLTVKPASKDDGDALGEIVWQMRSGDSGQWQNIEGALSRKTYNFESKTVGKWQVRAMLTNRLTGITKPTSTATLVAYDRPSIEIKQDRVVVQGQEIPVHLQYEDGTLIGANDLNIQWSVDGITWADGDVSAKILPDSKAMKIYARAQFADTQNEADTESWVSDKISARVIRPEKITVKVSGPSKAETGKPFTISGRHDDDYSSVQDAAYIEEWTLPDGTTQRGSSVTWSSLEENADLKFTYSVWLDGFEEQTKNTMTHTVKTWGYKFPEVTGGTKQGFKLAPTEIQVYSTTKYPVFDGVTYELVFDADPGIEIISVDKTKMVGKITKAGTYNVRMTVKDNRGNNETKEFIFAADEALPMVLNVEQKPSNKFLRAPLDVLFKVGVRLDHDKDNVKSYEWTVDGTKLTDGVSREVVSNLAAGDHAVQLDVTSEFGQRGTYETTVHVIPNTKPVCTPGIDQTVSTWRVRANCLDSDGRILAYRWEVAGSPVSASSPTISFSKSTYESPVVVNGVAVDDSGDETPFSVTLQ